jgi:very-short-patch-repair endonuclease
MKEIKKIFARILRKDQTKAEKIVWELLRKRKFRNYKFRRQHVIEGFVLDFYCHELKLGIELDGEIHLKRKEYDQLRQDIIESEGISVIRINNNEITGTNKEIIAKIEKTLFSHPTLLPLGEGGKRKNVVNKKLDEGCKPLTCLL